MLGDTFRSLPSSFAHMRGLPICDTPSPQSVVSEYGSLGSLGIGGKAISRKVGNEQDYPMTMPLLHGPHTRGAGWYDSISRTLGLWLTVRSSYISQAGEREDVIPASLVRETLLCPLRALMRAYTISGHRCTDLAPQFIFLFSATERDGGALELPNYIVINKATSNKVVLMSAKCMLNLDYL